jgi:hypothetical protein
MYVRMCFPSCIIYRLSIESRVGTDEFETKQNRGKQRKSLKLNALPQGQESNPVPTEHKVRTFTADLQSFVLSVQNNMKQEINPDAAYTCDSLKKPCRWHLTYCGVAG